MTVCWYVCHKRHSLQDPKLPIFHHCSRSFVLIVRKCYLQFTVNIQLCSPQDNLIFRRKICAPPILFWPWPPYNLPEVMFNLDFLCQCLLMGTTLRAAPSKSHAFSTNYHACIAMPTWPRCAPPILFWPWPAYNLLPRSCLTWIFFVNPHWSCDGYHFGCSAQQKLCLFNKLSCIYCNANMT